MSENAVHATFLLVLPMITVAVGLLLMYRSGRVSAKHLCMNCKYDLRGLPTTRVCPECGSRLDGTNTIVPGQVITRRWRWIVGALMISIGSIWLMLGMLAMVIVQSMGA